MSRITADLTAKRLLVRGKPFPITAHVLSNYMPVPETGCWLWCGGWSPLKYGRASNHGNVITAHRLFYLIYKGEIPEGMCVCHRCDTPPCINPDHLFLGTRAENNQDAARKGRWVGAPGRAKLTAQEATLIRGSRLQGRGLAKRFGISEQTVCDIRHGRRWERA